MDPFTHILFGNACALGATRQPGRLSGELMRRVPVATAAALFPDIDYLGFLIDPLVFLADWHRGHTHSLLLLPFWAGVVSLPFLLLRSYRSAWREVYLVSCLVLASHIFLDLTTVYGTGIFIPLSDGRFSFAITFVVDLLVTLPLLLALLSCRWLPVRLVMSVCFLLLGGYWTAQWLLKQQSLTRVASVYPAAGELHAIPQPFSPFNWKMVRQTEDGYRLAYLNLLAGEAGAGWLERLGLPLAAYRPPDDLQWRHHYRFGEDREQRATVKAAWSQPAFAPFRRFASFPALYRYEPAEAGGSCVWFTDLRYALPFLPPSFRYGLCREDDGDEWRVYRLGALGDDKRVALP